MKKGGKKKGEEEEKGEGEGEGLLVGGGEEEKEHPLGLRRGEGGENFDLKDLWSVLYVLDTTEFDNFSKFEEEYGSLTTLEEVFFFFFFFLLLFFWGGGDNKWFLYLY